MDKNKTLILEPKYLKAVMEILQHYVPDCDVWAFGSRVSGKAQKYSDLDLVLIASDKLDWHRLEALKDAFSISNLPMSIDVLDWHAISPKFREIIKENYIVLQTKNT